MIVKLQRKNSRYPDLTTNRQYVVIGIEADDFRMLNDQGRPYLYPSRLFKIVDSYEPENWITEWGDDDERYAYPPPLNGSGFFEDFFDDKKRQLRLSGKSSIKTWLRRGQRLSQVIKNQCPQ